MVFNISINFGLISNYLFDIIRYWEYFFIMFIVYNVYLCICFLSGLNVKTTLCNMISISWIIVFLFFDASCTVKRVNCVAVTKLFKK